MSHHAWLEVGVLNFILEKETGKKVKKLTQVMELVSVEDKIGILTVLTVSSVP